MTLYPFTTDAVVRLLKITIKCLKKKNHQNSACLHLVYNKKAHRTALMNTCVYIYACKLHDVTDVVMVIYSNL